MKRINWNIVLQVIIALVIIYFIARWAGGIRAMGQNPHERVMFL